MEDAEQQDSLRPAGSMVWWKIIGAAVLAYIAVQIPMAASTPWPIFDHLSRSSVSMLVVLSSLIIALLWIISFFALPLWIAWLTDARSSSHLLRHQILRPANLTASRQAIQRIQSTISSQKQTSHSSYLGISTAVDGVIALIVRDFVVAWHTPLLSGVPDDSLIPGTLAPSSQFPNIVESTIRDSMDKLVTLISSIDLAQLTVCKLLPLVTKHMKLFEEAEMRWRGSGSAAEIAEGEESDVFLAALYNSGHLHPAVGNIASPDTKLTELDHLRKVAVRAMNHVLPKRESKSKGVNIVVRELIASVILKQVIDALSEPDTLNALLEEKAGAALQEQKLVSRLREALDKQGFNIGTTNQATDSSALSSVSSAPKFKENSRVSATSYDSFMDDISNSKSILDARRTRDALLQQIRKTESALSGDQGETEVKRKQLSVYLRRLTSALDAVDRRMNQLGTSSSTQEHRDTVSAVVLSELAKTVTLRDVLTSPSAISHFLEFMESRNHSIFVQFWLSVNTFKNPLEVAESDSEDDGYNDRQLSSQTQSSSSTQLARVGEVKTLMEDLLFYVDSYYRSSQILAVVQPRYVDIAKTFVDFQAGDQQRVTNRSVKVARRSVLKAQKQIYDEMVEDDWAAFQKSRAWHRMLEDLHRESIDQVPSVSVPHSSSFQEHKHLENSRLERTNTSRVTSHAHLFGTSSASSARGPTSSSGLFDEDDDNDQGSGLKSPGFGMNSSLDQLMGGKGATFDGIKGRAPLFREALFDDEDAQSGVEEEQQSSKKEALVQVEKIDAFENVLASIIQEDLPPDQATLKRPSQESRPSFRRSATLSKTSLLGEPSSFDIGEEEDAGGLVSPRSSPNLVQDPRFSQRTIVRTPADVRSDLAQLQQSIKRLEEQEELLSALLRKAELTGSSAKETRLMEKSKTTIARELRELRFEVAAIATTQQQHQDNLQVNIIPGKVRIQIHHANLSQDTDGKDYATYLIEVSHLAPKNSNGPEDGEMVAKSGWVVSRRYNEFYALHNRLKDKYNQIRALDHIFPGKSLTGSVNAKFLENRGMNLQKYLQEIVKWEFVCSSRELNTFLSQSVQMFSADLFTEGEMISNVATTSGLVSRLYRGVTGVAEGLDEILFGPSMFETIVNRLSNGVVDLVGFNEMERILAGATMSSAAEIKEATQVTNTLFTGPICDAVIELFQLKLEGNWFRRQAIIIVVQQALGGTIERKLRQTIAEALEPVSLINYVTMVRNIMWPNGKLKQAELKRSLEEKRARRQNALKKLSTLIPNLASNFIGRDNARRAARRSWAILQNKRLNKHIIYTIMDQVLDDMFIRDDASDDRERSM